MKLLPIFLLVGVLSACATTPAPNPWDGLTVDTKPAAQPVDCGSFPLPSERIGDDIVYNNAGLNDLDDYRACSEANKAIVVEHAAQIGQLKVARKNLVEAGQAQRRIADLRAEILEDERKHMFWERLGLWAIAIAGVAL